MKLFKYAQRQSGNKSPIKPSLGSGMFKNQPVPSLDMYFKVQNLHQTLHHLTVRRYIQPHSMQS